LFDSIIKGLVLLEPYIAELNIDPVPDSFPNGTPNHSHMVTIGVITGKIDCPEFKEDKLMELGWRVDWPYYTLYVPNIFEKQTRG
jgi:hypothetical protein